MKALIGVGLVGLAVYLIARAAIPLMIIALVVYVAATS